MDRYAIRLVDETAQIDITLWEAVGHRARRLREGNHILISGLTTSKVYKNAKGDVTWYVNGSTNCDTKIVNGKCRSLSYTLVLYPSLLILRHCYSVDHKMLACFIIFSQNSGIKYD
jgi:hypothetical protein